MTSPARRPRARTFTVGILLAQVALAISCAPLTGPSDPVRMDDVVGEGDATRRASQRLVAQGLEADGIDNDRLALSQYERALSVDPTNPYAYLALARHHIERADYARALEYVDQAELLFGAQDDEEGSVSPRAEAHIAGLRGAALRGMGRVDEGNESMRRAADLAPSVWGDGRLTPGELR